MPRPTLQTGDILTDDLANSAGLPILDGSDEYGHGPKIVDEWLDDEPDQIKARFYAWYNRMQVTGDAGLTVNYTGASVLLLDGSIVSVPAGSLTLPANQTSFVFVNDAGAVAFAATFPAQAVPLALAVTNGTDVVTLQDLRSQVNEVVRPIAVDGGGGFDIGDSKESSRATPSPGWVRHDNALYNATDYPIAAGVIGTIHSLPGDAPGTFRVPPADVVTVAAGSTFALGDTGGARTVSLSGAQTGRHGHVINESAHTHPGRDAGHIHPTREQNHTHSVLASFQPEDGFTDSLIVKNSAIAGEDRGNKAYVERTNNGQGQRLLNPTMTGLQVQTGKANIFVDGAKTNISLQEAGNGAPHENMPPYVACNKFIRLF